MESIPKQADALIEALDINARSHIDIETIIQKVIDLTRWGICVHQVDDIEMDGAYFKESSTSTNHILLKTGLAKTKANHVLFHEIGHILFGHQTIDVVTFRGTQIKGALQRSKQTTLPKEEKEAEIFALKLSTLYRKADNSPVAQVIAGIL